MALENCTSTEECIANGTVKFCYVEAKFSLETNFCECYSWYGWTGEDCDETSIALYYNRIVAIIYILWATAIILLSARLLILNLLANDSRKVDALAMAIVYTTFAAFFFLLYAITRTMALFDPSRFVLQDYNSFVLGAKREVFDLENGRFAAFCLVLASFCQNMASLSLMISWIGVVRKVNRFRFQQSRIESRQLRFERGLKISGLVYLLILVLLLGTHNTLDAYLFVALVGLLVAVAYVVVTVNFDRAFMNIEHKTESITVFNMISFVRFICRYSCLFLILISLASILTSLLSSAENYEGKNAPGTFVPAVLTGSLGLLAVLGSLTLNIWYANSISDGPVLADLYPRLCCIFGFWDNKNKMLINDNDGSVAVSSIHPSSYYATSHK